MSAISADLLAELGLEADDLEVQHGVEDAEAIARLVRTLVDARKKSGLTQKQVAERMGTTQSAVSDLERTAGDPRLSTLQRFGRAVGLRVRVAAVYDAPAYVSKTAISVGRSESARPATQMHWHGTTERLVKSS
jgi:transcriptional regulator with XRE-family HTH domain